MMNIGRLPGVSENNVVFHVAVIDTGFCILKLEEKK